MKGPMLIVVILIVVGGLVVGLGMAGIVDIPGLSPTKKKPTAAKTDKKGKTDASATEGAGDKKAAADTTKKAPQPKEKPAPVDDKPPAPKLDASLGAKRVAKLWNEMDIAALTPICKQWKDEDLALVFAKMDDSKVADLLKDMEPERASAIIRIIEKNASVVASAP